MKKQINNDYIDNKKKYILEHIDIITSEIIRREVSNNEENLSFFVKISNVVDSLKFKNPFFYNKERKEYMKECIYAQFKFKENFNGIKIDDYLSFLQDNLSKLNTSNNEVSLYIGDKQQITLKKSLKNDNRYFFQTFTHELMHCISHIDNQKKMGLGYGNCSSFKHNKYLGIDEMETELLQQKVLKQYFPQYVENNIPEKIILKNGLDEQYELSFNRSGNGYISLMTFSNIIDELYGKELMQTYLSLDVDCNIETVFDMYTLNKFAELSQHYEFYGYFQQKNKGNYCDYTLYMSMQHIVSDLIAYYLQTNNKTIDDVKDIILENSRFLINSNGLTINLNELLLKEVEQKLNKTQDVFIDSSYHQQFYSVSDDIRLAVHDVKDRPKDIFGCSRRLKLDVGFVKMYLSNDNHESIIELCKDKYLDKTIGHILLDDLNLNKFINKLNNGDLTLDKIPSELLECKSTLLYIIENTSEEVITKENILNNIHQDYKINFDVLQVLDSPRNTLKKVLMEL